MFPLALEWATRRRGDEETMQVLITVGSQPKISVTPSSVQVVFSEGTADVALILTGPDAVSEMHDLLTQAALDLENAAGMNAAFDNLAIHQPTVLATDNGDADQSACTCADKENHLPWCPLVSTPSGQAVAEDEAR